MTSYFFNFIGHIRIQYIDAYFYIESTVLIGVAYFVTGKTRWKSPEIINLPRKVNFQHDYKDLEVLHQQFQLGMVIWYLHKNGSYFTTILQFGLIIQTLLYINYSLFFLVEREDENLKLSMKIDNDHPIIISQKKIEYSLK